MPEPEPYEPAKLTGNAPADLQAETARLSSVWDLGKLNEISDEQARDDLARISAHMMAIVAQSAARRRRQTRPRRRTTSSPQGKTAAEKFLLRWRGEAEPGSREGDRHLLDLHRRARAERLDLHRAHHRLDRRRLRRGDVGAPSARSAARCTAARRPACCRCSTRSRRRATPSGYVENLLDHARADHGLRPPRLPRRGSALARSSRRRRRSSARRASRSPRTLEAAALPSCTSASPSYVIATNVEFYSAVVLDLAEIPPTLTPAMFACARVAGWSAHILEEKRTGRLFRPSAHTSARAARPASDVAIDAPVRS